MDHPAAGGFVREARAQDAESLARLQVASWRLSFAGIVPDALLAELTGDEARKVWRDRWREAITNPPTSRHRVLVAVESRPAATSGGTAAETSGAAAAPGGTAPGGAAAAASGRAAVASREVVGFVSAGPATDADRWPGTDAELYELRVDPERAGRGHDGRLLHAAADTLSHDGFRTLVIWAPEADQALLQFLESAGWAADGARGELDVGVSVPVIRLHTALTE